MRRTSAAAAVGAVVSIVAIGAFSAAPATAQTPGRALACDSAVIAEDGMTDVRNDNVHEAAIDCAVSWGIAQGTGTGTYSPAAPVSRAQMASFIARLISKSGGTLPRNAPDAFPDDAGSPHEPNITALAAAGIVTGTSSSSYSPAAPVTRGQMASFLVRAYEHRASRKLPAAPDVFADDAGSVHEANINKAVGAGFARGLADGRFGTGAAVRRDQMASFLTRMLEQVLVDSSLFGSCTPTTVAAQDIAELALALPAAQASVSRVAMDVGFDGDSRDLVLALDNGSAEAGLVVGTAASSTGGDVRFRDGAEQRIGDLSPLQGRLSGTATPVEPLSKLTGPYASGGWTLLVMNAGDAPVHITGCALALTMLGGAMPLGAVAPASITDDLRDDAAALTVLVVLAGMPLLLALAHPRTARRGTAALACVGLTSTLVVVAGVATPAQAAEPTSVRTHPWGAAPDGRVITATEDIPNENSDGVAISGGLFTVPVTCSDLPCHTRLTADATDREPAISPSGQQVVFVRTVGEADHLMALSMATGQTRSLMTFPEALVNGEFQPVREVHPTWSPDEQRIAGSYRGRLFTISAQGGAASFIAQEVGSDPLICTDGPEDTRFQRRSPSWSPDGSRLVYTRSEIGTFCFAQEARQLFSAPVGNIEAESRLGSLVGIRSVDHAPDGPAVVVAGTYRSDAGTCEGSCMPRLVSASTGAVISTVELSSGGSGSGDRPRWSPSGTHLLAGGDLVEPSGEPWQEYRQCVDPDGVSWNCYLSQTGRGLDLQCSPGNCLSGIALRVTRPGTGSFTGMLQASGAINGPLSEGYLFAKKQPGSHGVQVTGDGATINGISCDDANSTASGSSITYRVEDAEIVTCTVDLGVPNDRDGDDIRDDVDPCPDEPLNNCAFDKDGDGIPDGSDPCPEDPTNTCAPPPPPPGETCRAFLIEVSAAVGGFQDIYPFGQVTIDGAVCRKGEVETLKSLSVAADDITDPGIKALTGVFFELEPDPSTVKLTPIGASGGTVTASYDLCMLPLLGLGKVLGAGVTKTLKLAAKFGAERLLRKAIDIAFGAWFAALKLAVRGAKQNFDVVLDSQRERLKTIVTDTFTTGLDLGTDEGFEVNACIPFTFWAMQLDFYADGDSVRYNLEQLPGFGDLTLTTNARPTS